MPDTIFCDAVSTASLAHGHAALLLVESLIHGLIEREALSPDDAVRITEYALDTATVLAEESGHDACPSSRFLLEAIANTLRVDACAGANLHLVRPS